MSQDQDDQGEKGIKDNNQVMTDILPSLHSPTCNKTSLVYSQMLTTYHLYSSDISR